MKRCVLSQILFYVAAFGASLIVISKTQAQDQNHFPNLNERYYLQTNIDSPVPALVINFDPKKPSEAGYALSHSELFENGTLFQVTDSYTIGNYLSAMVPLVFVHPIKSNGEVDLTKTLAFPASAIKNENTNRATSEYPGIKQDMSNLYRDQSYYSSDKELSSNEAKAVYEAEAVKLDNSLQKHEQNIGRSDYAVYQGQKRPKSRTAPVIARSDVAVDGPQETRKPKENLTPAVAPTPAASVSEPAVQVTQKTETPAKDAESLKPFSGAVTVHVAKEIQSFGKEVASSDGRIKGKAEIKTIEVGERFLAIDDGGKILSGETSKTTFRRFYKLKRNGEIEKNASGEPEVYLLPIDNLKYRDPLTNEIKPVTKESVLFIKETAAPVTGEQEEVKSPTPAPTTPVVATPTKPLIAESLGATSALSECRNQLFAKELAASGENCRLVEIKDFQLVKSQLIQQLKGQSQLNSILMSSGVIALDNSSKQCSKLEITHKEYLDDTKAQQKITEYKQNMSDAYKKIVQAFHHGSVRVGAAFHSMPDMSKHTYSCSRDQSTCRFSYDNFEPENLPLKYEVTLYADDISKQEKMKIYGPNKDHKYLVVLKRGGVDVRALVVKDPSSRVVSRFGGGPLQNIFGDIKSFNSEFKYHRLSDIQEQYNSDRLKDSKTGHFIETSTIDLKGKKITQEARFGTPQSLSLIGKMRNNNTFYKLECNFDVLKRKDPLPKWNPAEQPSATVQ